jgi:hypothetical protein
LPIVESLAKRQQSFITYNHALTGIAKEDVRVQGATVQHVYVFLVS